MYLQIYMGIEIFGNNILKVCIKVLKKTCPYPGILKMGMLEITHKPSIRNRNTKAHFKESWKIVLHQKHYLCNTYPPLKIL